MADLRISVDEVVLEADWTGENPETRRALEAALPVASAGVVTNLVGSGVQTLEATIGDLEIFDVAVAENAPIADQPLADVALPRESFVDSAADGDSVAGPETVLTAGRTSIGAA